MSVILRDHHRRNTANEKHPYAVPLDGQGRVNEAELRRHVDWLTAKGVHGLYPNGSTGDFTRFSVEERRRIIKIVCDQAAGRVPARTLSDGGYGVH